MEYEEYFLDIIHKHLKPTERASPPLHWSLVGKVRKCPPPEFRRPIETPAVLTSEQEPKGREARMVLEFARNCHRTC